MADKSKIYLQEEEYKLIERLIEEVKLRRYSSQTEKFCILVVNEFLASKNTH